MVRSERTLTLMYNGVKPPPDFLGKEKYFLDTCVVVKIQKTEAPMQRASVFLMVFGKWITSTENFLKVFCRSYPQFYGK